MRIDRLTWGQYCPVCVLASVLRPTPLRQSRSQTCRPLRANKLKRQLHAKCNTPAIHLYYTWRRVRHEESAYAIDSSGNKGATNLAIIIVTPVRK
jgi:hypothetical protein